MAVSPGSGCRQELSPSETSYDRAKATRILDFKKLRELGLIVREGHGRGTYYRRP